MKQRKIVLTVYDSDGKVVFSKDPAVPQDVMPCLQLFDEIGNEICVAIREYSESDKD